MKSTESISVLDFAKTHRQEILDCLSKVTTSMPSAASGVDFRNQISHIYCRMLERAFPNVFEAVYDKEHDIIYLLNSDGKVSMKSMEKVFQRESKRPVGKMTKPSNIMFINCLGENNDEKLEKALTNISWLLVIQRGKVNDDGITTIGFALISSKHLGQLIKRSPSCVKSTNDQIQLVIPNDEYDYFSGLNEVSINKNPAENAERNHNFYQCHKEFCDGVLDFNPSGQSKSITAVSVGTPQSSCDRPSGIR